LSLSNAKTGIREKTQNGGRDLERESFLTPFAFAIFSEDKTEK